MDYPDYIYDPYNHELNVPLTGMPNYDHPVCNIDDQREKYKKEEYNKKHNKEININENITINESVNSNKQFSLFRSISLEDWLIVCIFIIVILLRYVFVMYHEIQILKMKSNITI